MAVDDRLAELNPKTRTCVVLGGGGFLGRSLVLRLLKLGKWIVRVADSAHSLRLDPSSECDSVLSNAISSGRLSYHHVDVRHKSSVCEGIFFSPQFFAFKLLRALVDEEMRGKSGSRTSFFFSFFQFFCVNLSITLIFFFNFFNYFTRKM